MKFLFLFFIISSNCFGQAESSEINVINKRLDSIAQLEAQLIQELEILKLTWIQNEINTVGIPTAGIDQEIIRHSAYQLSYNEEHEQANWVMHIILPDIIKGNNSRSNDFREDPLVKNSSAQEIDYFLKELNEDGSYSYDGFGYDRGHLAPSADFKWSEKALSESYFYSNMTPQIGDFNRLKWAELENWLRGYVTDNETNLIIITAPILTPNLKKIERSPNSISIPEYFIKVALDLKNNRGIGFILPHQKIERPLESYTVSIDSIEQLMGYDLFPDLDNLKEQDIESKSDYKPWLPARQKGDVKAIETRLLPKKSINTNDLRQLIDDGERHTVCGKVVSTKKHKKGHVFINLDKKFPNQILSVSIFESNIKNFEYEPEIYLKDKEVCITAKIGDYKDVPNMVLNHSKQIKLLRDY